MSEHLQWLILIMFCVCSESTIRMQRDFTYPTVEEFNVYWNVPTFLCHKHGVNFENHTRKFGIISNSGDNFRGSVVNILYDPGLFPAMMKNSRGRISERNGGIPQLGNLTLHLQSFKEVVEKIVPENFNGVGIIDFEAWRPIFRQNWNDQVIYKVMSKELVRQHHPQWTEKKIELYASYYFEEASEEFMKNTLRLAKLLRPKGTWGYYAFPYCYNYRESGEPHCSDTVEKENNRIQWLFDESSAIYPSLYMSEKLSEEDHRKFVIGRLNEAWRVASRVASRKIPPVFPYIWYKYYDSTKFLSQENRLINRVSVHFNQGDIYTALETTKEYKMGGAVIWGATENVSSREKCLLLLDYLHTVLGPAVLKVKKNTNKAEKPEHESLLGFIHLPLISSDESALVNQTVHLKSKSREERSTTLSPTLENYYAWSKTRKKQFGGGKRRRGGERRGRQFEEFIADFDFSSGAIFSNCEIF